MLSLPCVSDPLQYACQSNGLPSGRVEVRGRHGLNPRLGSTPISLWFARGCVLRPDGMACQVLADRGQLQQVRCGCGCGCVLRTGCQVLADRGQLQQVRCGCGCGCVLRTGCQVLADRGQLQQVRCGCGCGCVLRTGCQVLADRGQLQQVRCGCGCGCVLRTGCQVLADRGQLQQVRVGTRMFLEGRVPGAGMDRAQLQQVGCAGKCVEVGMGMAVRNAYGEVPSVG